jgi:hypothetical protein
MKFALAVLIVVIILAAAALLPVRQYLDFQVLYHATLGLLRGISLYDHAGQVNMIAQLANVPPAQVFVLPFPYPPWYALSTMWLALLPIDQASRVWFALNLIMVFISVSLLTSGHPPRIRIALFLGGLLWLPVLGSLFVGQYGFPVLLGAALMIHGLRRERAMLVALAAALLTFKPHLGGVVVLLIGITLARRGDRFGRNALLALLAAGVILFAVGFLASPNWPLDYFYSLTGFRDVSQCGQCVSLSMALAGLFGGGLDQAVWISTVSAALLCTWLVLRWQQVTSTAGGLVAAGILVTMIVNPYLQNYDYLLLLVPFIETAHRIRIAVDWIGSAMAYMFPPISLALWGTAGNASLVASACILFIITARQLASGMKVSASHG